MNECNSCGRDRESLFNKGVHHVQAIVWTMLGIVMIFWPEHAPKRLFDTAGMAYLLLGVAQARIATLCRNGIS